MGVVSPFVAKDADMGTVWNPISVNATLALSDRAVTSDANVMDTHNVRARVKQTNASIAKITPWVTSASSASKLLT